MLSVHEVPGFESRRPTSRSFFAAITCRTVTGGFRQRTPWRRVRLRWSSRGGALGIHTLLYGLFWFCANKRNPVTAGGAEVRRRR